MNIIKKLWKEEEGQALTEYGLIIGLIAAICVGLLATIGDNVKILLNRIANALTTASTK